MKTIYLIIFYLVIFPLSLNCEEGSAFQELYEIEVELESSERSSINRGMKKALEDLMIQLSGSSEINKYEVIKKELNDPEDYIGEYRLSVRNEKIFGIFSFNGELVRKLLSDNSLPLWIGIKPKILMFLPCKFQVDLPGGEEITEKHKQLCIQVNKDLLAKANLRNIVFIEPSLDLTDLKYLDLYQPKSDNDFLNKIALRYGLKSWIICYIQDEFGILKVEPTCLTKISSSKGNSLNKTVKFLANELSKDFQLKIDPNIKVGVSLVISGIEQYTDLVLLEDIIRANPLVVSFNLTSILGSSVTYQLNIKGQPSDLKKLMNVNPLMVDQQNSWDSADLHYFFRGRD